MEKFFKLLLIFLGVVLMALPTKLLGLNLAQSGENSWDDSWMKREQIHARNGEVTVSQLKKNTQNGTRPGNILVDLNTLTSPLLRIVPDGKEQIKNLDTDESNISLKNGAINIYKKGLYLISFDVYDDKEKESIDCGFCVNYKAYLFYGDVSQIDKLEDATRVSSKITLAGKTLTQSIGVPSGYFDYSWWRLAKSEEEEGVLIGEKLNNMKCQEILEKARKHYPDHQGSLFLKVQFSDGMGNYDPHTGTNFERSHCMVELVPPSPFAPPSYQLNLAPQGEGQLFARVDRQLLRSGDKVQSSKEVSLEVRPDPDYRLKAGSLRVVDTQGHQIPVRNNGFEMPESNVTIFAEFELIPPPTPKKYAISFSHEGEGSLVAKVDNQPINSGTLIEEGKTVVFTATPADKWRIKNWEPENGTSQEYRILSVSQAVSVKVVFESMPTPPMKRDYTVTIAPLQNGTIVATPAKAKAGAQVQLEVNPAVGYRLKEGSLTVTSVGNQTISVLDNRFIMPNAEVNIIAEFEPIPLDPETLLPHLTGIDTTPLKKGTGYTFVWEEMEKTATNFTLELIDTKTHKQVTNLDSSVDVNQVQLQFSQVGVFDLKIKFEVAGKAYFVTWRIIVE